MLNKNKVILLCDFSTEIDKETLDRKKVLQNVRMVIGEKSLVGVQTQQLAQVQNMNFEYSIVVRRFFYDKQTFLFIDNQLYKIMSITPAKSDNYCKLNVQRENNEDLVKAINEYFAKVNNDTNL